MATVRDRTLPKRLLWDESGYALSKMGLLNGIIRERQGFAVRCFGINSIA